MDKVANGKVCSKNSTIIELFGDEISLVRKCYWRDFYL